MNEIRTIRNSSDMIFPVNSLSFDEDFIKLFVFMNLKDFNQQISTHADGVRADGTNPWTTFRKVLLNVIQ